jgi:hypothetical protein
MQYQTITQMVLLSVEWRILQTVICGAPYCKKARLVDFWGLRENAPWIRSTSSCEVLGLPSPLLSGAGHYQSLEIALTNAG